MQKQTHHSFKLTPIRWNRTYKYQRKQQTRIKSRKQVRMDEIILVFHGIGGAGDDILTYINT